jgi:hypothetical protein
VRAPRPLLRLALAAALVLLAPAAALAEVALLRGPYLQSGSTERVIVRWRTDVASDSRVRWGLSPEALDRVAEDSASVVEHAVELTGLAPETAYFYSIGTSTEVLAGGDAGHRFRTPPEAGAGRPVRLWALGDHGTGDAAAASVRAGFTSWNGNRPVDGLLLLGDNAYWSGTDAELSSNLFGPAQPYFRGLYVWPAYGNHDGMSSNSLKQEGPYYEAFTLPREGEAGGRPSGTEAYYSFDVGDVHVIVLDSFESPTGPGSKMIDWLTLDLAANLRPWTIVAMHHPPYTFGSHNSDNPDDSGGLLFRMREDVVPVLDEAGVDILLTGHSHGYERSRPVDGHYGTSETYDSARMGKIGGDGDPDGSGAYVKYPGPRSGIVHVVSGSSGSASAVMSQHPVMVRAKPELGSFVLEIEGARAAGFFGRPDGRVADHFELRHGDGTLLVDDFESGGLGRWSVQN